MLSGQKGGELLLLLSPYPELCLKAALSQDLPVACVYKFSLLQLAELVGLRILSLVTKILDLVHGKYLCLVLTSCPPPSPIPLPFLGENVFAMDSGSPGLITWFYQMLLSLTVSERSMTMSE